jgi:N-acyl-L-homoserine lactone synthetase
VSESGNHPPSPDRLSPRQPSHSELARALGPARLFAQELVAGAAPIRFAVAVSDIELEAVFQLRYQVVMEKGWADGRDLRGTVERDRFDECAVHIAGWDDTAIAATARLVFPAPGERLPTEEEFDLVVEPAGSVVDVGRGIVAPAYRDPRHHMFVALLAACWLQVWDRGFHLMCGDAAPSLLQGYRDMGFDVTLIGPARRHWGGPGIRS